MLPSRGNSNSFPESARNEMCEAVSIAKLRGMFFWSNPPFANPSRPCRLTRVSSAAAYLCAALCAGSVACSSNSDPATGPSLAGAPAGGGAADSAAGMAGLAAGVAGAAAGIGGSAAGGSPSGGASAGGASAGGSSAGATAQSDAGFTLLYRDDFERFDATRWQVMTHSWDTNLAVFSQQSVSVRDGRLELALLPAPTGTTDPDGAAKSFFGAEVRSVDTLTYGRVRARMKFASGSAVVSSLVTIYTPWPADNWNELDIEHLGAKPASTQFNTMVYTGAPVTPPATKSVTPTQDPYPYDHGYAVSDDFHVFTIEWTPASAKFYVDDIVAYTWTKRIALMNQPQNVLMTIWASSSVAWAGAVTDETGKAVVSYDWIELYRYTAP